MSSSVLVSKCVVTPSRAFKERQLTAAVSISQGETVLAERPLVQVPLRQERGYRYGTYAWDLVAALLTEPALLQEYEQWNLKATKLLFDEFDQQVEAELATEFKVTPGRIRSLFFSVGTNNVGQLDVDRNVAGHGLYRLMSRADHSCVPNTCIVPGQPTSDIATLAAVRDIRAGEPLTWCYFEEEPFLGASYEDRNLALVNLHRFVCRCSRCQTERPAHLKGQSNLVGYFDKLIAAAARKWQEDIDAGVATMPTGPLSQGHRYPRSTTS